MSDIVISIPDVPLATDLTGATIVGLNSTLQTRRFTLDQLVRNNIGQFKTTDATPPTPLLNQNYELIGTAVGTSPAGTYTHLLGVGGTPIVIPAPAAGNAITGAKAVWNGTYWVPIWQEVTLPTVDMSNYYNKAAADALIGFQNSVNLPTSPLDFSTFTSSVAGSGGIFINQVCLAPSNCFLTSLRCKTTIGATITPYVYTITGSPGSFVVTLIHTYASFVATATTNTQVITDNYLVPSGAYIGFSLSGGTMYYKSSGSDITPALTNWAVQQIAYDITVNTNTTGVGPQVIALGLRTTALESSVSAYPVTANVPTTPLDFSSFTSTTNPLSTTIFVNQLSQIPATGFLQSFRIKTTVGTVITPYAYTVTGSPGSFVWTLVHTFASFTATATTHTQTIVDSYLVPANAYIGMSVSGGNIYYKGSGSDLVIPAANWNGAQSIAYDTVFNFSSTGIGGAVSLLTNRVSALENAPAALTQVPLKPVLLFEDPLTSFTAFTVAGWSLAAGGGATPTATGASNSIWNKNRYRVIPRRTSIEVTLVSDSVFWIEFTTLGNPNNGGACAVDMAANTLYIYSGGPTTFTQVASGVVSYTLTSGRKFSVQIDILDPWKNVMTIMDTITGSSYSLTYSVSTTSYNTEMVQDDSFKVYLKTGTTTGVKVWSMSVSSKKNPLVWISGDSILAGAFFTPASYYQRYPLLLKAALGGSVLVSAKGSGVLAETADTVETELQFIKPTYAVISIGTNTTGFTNTALTTLVNRIIALGSTPIVNRIPCNGGYSDFNANNSIIEAVCLATGAIVGARFDIATALNNDVPSGYNPAMFTGADQVHPNTIGNAAMFARFAIDCPYLFI